MGVPVSSRNDLSRHLFRLWLRDMDVLVGRVVFGSESWEFGEVVRAWSGVLVPSYRLVSWYRDGGYEDLKSCAEDPVWAYFARCMGHRLNRRVVLGSPRVSALCAWAFFDGRWRECEGVLGGDPVACYLYAGLLGGRLPRVLHSRMVMEGMVGKSVALCRYLQDYC